MLSDRAFFAASLTAIVAGGLVASPALSAAALDMSRADALSALVGRFTPATGDPILLARYAQLSDEARANFRFTPALPRTENRAVTLVVRARPSGIATNSTAGEEAILPVKITPVTYRLGSAVGYTAFAATPAEVNIAALPQARRPGEIVDRTPSRFGADMRLDSRSLPGTPARSLDPDRAYSVDVTGSYRLSRHVDVTAGVRLQRENDRLAPLTDQQRDSQAVYVGTQFRF